MALAARVRAAANLLGVAPGASEAEARHAFREAARHAHPDKTGEASSEEFLKLREALDTLLEHGTPAVPPAAAAATGPPQEKESDRLDKHFFGTAFNSDNFDPRAWPGQADAGWLASGQPVQCVWRCKLCPEASSVCCRMKPKKHSCICGHKVEAHNQAKGFSCTASGCRCPRLSFHVQQLGWEVRCACKHHVRDHAASGAAPWACTKRIPGKDKKPCPCKGFHASWVCTCGHGWDQHETTWSTAVSKAVFAREWVAQGLRPECVEEALEKRAKWDSEAAALAAEVGAEEASRRMAAKAQRIGVSMCAEARMQEAVAETVDGTRLPMPAAPARGHEPALAAPPAAAQLHDDTDEGEGVSELTPPRQPHQEQRQPQRTGAPRVAHPVPRLSGRLEPTAAAAAAREQVTRKSASKPNAAPRPASQSFAAPPRPTRDRPASGQRSSATPPSASKAAAGSGRSSYRSSSASQAAAPAAAAPRDSALNAAPTAGQRRPLLRRIETNEEDEELEGGGFDPRYSAPAAVHGVAGRGRGGPPFEVEVLVDRPPRPVAAIPTGRRAAA